MSEYLTTMEAAEALKMSASTLSKMRSRQEGPPYSKLGATVRYRREDLDAWASTNLVTPDGKPKYNRKRGAWVGRKGK